MIKPPTPQELQYFDLCFLELKRRDNLFICYVRENPTSIMMKNFMDTTTFGTMRKAILWLTANARKGGLKL